MLKFRATGPKGGLGVLEIASDATVAGLRTLLQQKSGVSSTKQEILHGFPPKLLKAVGSDLLSKTALKSGESITVREGAEIVEATDTKSAGAGESKASESKSASSGSGSGSGSGGAGAGAGSESKSSVPLVRRVIDHDNSCLFNAISFVLDNRNRQGQETLRPLVAATILSDPTTYTEGYLGGKNAQEYAEYISNPEKWGGGIELAILAAHYEAEIAAVDIQTTNIYVYGDGNGWKKRAYLIYNGIHYDALVGNAWGENGDSKNDILTFDPADKGVFNSAKELAASLQKSKQFTNVTSFSLKCDDCKAAFVGAVDATEHAKATGHVNFVQY